MLLPPGRSSMWRLGYDTPVNHNDNVQNCGGTLYRYTKADGKCGVCGDPWNTGKGNNKVGGLYDKDIITAIYNPGSTIDVVIDDVVTNGGYFEFRLCENKLFLTQDSQECFQNGLLTIKSSSENKYFDIKNGENKLQLILPDNVTCDQCVLQWKYRTAEHYGCNKQNGIEKCCFGCGEIQNEYYACADIAIVNGDTNIYALENGFDVLQENVQIQPLKRKKRAPLTRMSMQEGIQVMAVSPTQSRLLPYTPILERLRNRAGNGIMTGSQGNMLWTWGRNVNRKREIQGLNGIRNGQAQSSRNGQAAGSRRTTVVRNLNGGRSGGTAARGGGQSNTFNGNTPPLRSMIRVDRPIRTQILRNGQPLGDMPFFPARERSNTRRTFISPINPTADALMIRSLTQEAISRYTHGSGNCKAIGPFRNKEMDDWCNTQCSGGNCVINECSCNGRRHPSSNCHQCPYGKCIGDNTQLNNIYPGIFNNYTDFLECASYDRIYGLGTYKVLAEGLPECSHPRFKRQITVPLEAEEFGCCGTRPQVIMPLTVKSEKKSFNVVQLPEDRNQFLVRGVCGRNSTVSCPMCVPEYNFQWVLVYDPRLDTNPPVNFVPVKFAHYCRCVNPGYNLGK